MVIKTGGEVRDRDFLETKNIFVIFAQYKKCLSRKVKAETLELKEG